MLKSTLFAAAVLAVSAAAFAPVQAMAQVDINLVIETAPPAPRYEVIPRPRAGYLWAPGYWDWRGNRHEWISGRWIVERPGYVYTQPHWVQHDGRWLRREARWDRRGRGDMDHDGIPNRYDRDRDGDGIPNRYDDHDNRGHHGRGHDKDHDGVPNRYDRDRDGDGVPNRYDNRPDNPRRN